MLEVIIEQMPKAIVSGLLVPVLQFAWKKAQERRSDHRKRDLRNRITELRQFLASSKDLETTPESVRAIEDGHAELTASVAELARLSAPRTTPAARAPDEPAPAYDWLARAFLLYPAARPLGWFFRAMFFVTLPLSALSVFGLTLSVRDNESTIGDVFLVAGMCLVFLAVIRFAAAAVDRTVSQPARNGWERWLLLYKPPTRRAAFFQVTFYLLAVLSIIGWVVTAAMAAGGDAEWSEAALGYLIISGFTLLVRLVARGLDSGSAQEPATDEAPKHYSLSKVGAVSLLILNLFLFAAACAAIASDANDQMSWKEFRESVLGAAPRVIPIVLAILCSAAWTLTARRSGEPGPASRNKLAALLIPRRAGLASWIATIVYVAGLLSIPLMPVWDAGSVQAALNDPGETATVAIIACLVPICARGWAGAAASRDSSGLPPTASAASGS